MNNNNEDVTPKVFCFFSNLEKTFIHHRCVAAQRNSRATRWRNKVSWCFMPAIRSTFTLRRLKRTGAICSDALSVCCSVTDNRCQAASINPPNSTPTPIPTLWLQMYRPAHHGINWWWHNGMSSQSETVLSRTHPLSPPNSTLPTPTS